MLSEFHKFFQHILSSTLYCEIIYSGVLYQNFTLQETIPKEENLYCLSVVSGHYLLMASFLYELFYYENMCRQLPQIVILLLCFFVTVTTSIRSKVLKFHSIVIFILVSLKCHFIHRFTPAKSIKLLPKYCFLSILDKTIFNSALNSNDVMPAK